MISEPGSISTDLSPLRALVIGRRPMTRAGLTALLIERADFLVIGQTRLSDASRLVVELQPDLALLAWEGDDVREIAELAETLGLSGRPLLLIGDTPDPPLLAALLRAGVRGILLAEATADDVSAAIDGVVRGLLVLDPLLGRTLALAAAEPAMAVINPIADEVQPGFATTADVLTDRERQVLRLLALGLPNKTIAKELAISEHTAKFHVGSILAKLSAGSRTEAVTRAARMGLLEL